MLPSKKLFLVCPSYTLAFSPLDLIPSSFFLHQSTLLLNTATVKPHSRRPARVNSDKRHGPKSSDSS